MSKPLIFEFPSSGDEYFILRNRLEAHYHRDVLVPVLALPKTTNTSSPLKYACHEDLSAFFNEYPEWKGFLEG
jgi:hypothetical protein